MTLIQFHNISNSRNKSIYKSYSYISSQPYQISDIALLCAQKVIQSAIENHPSHKLIKNNRIILRQSHNRVFDLHVIDLVCPNLFSSLDSKIMAAPANVQKVIVVGDSTVGKTALLIKYIDGVYQSTSTTVGVDFKNKNLVIDGKHVKMQLWDTAGQERFKTIAVSYYRRAHGVVIVYDVSNMQSFEHVPLWLDSVKQNTDRPVPLILIGNKCDLAPKVQENEGKQMAEENNVPFFLTSAKTGDGIDEAFEHLARMILEDREKEKAKEDKAPNVDINHGQTTKKKCC